jgi:hypothetical protein
LDWKVKEQILENFRERNCAKFTIAKGTTGNSQEN